MTFPAFVSQSTPLAALPAHVHPWHPDLGDGSYANPVLHADYSDPDVIRVGSEFWLTASSFTATPGLPILRSTDLVNWTLVGHALCQVPDPSYAALRPGCGVWAPSIREHGGRFWIFFPLPDEGIFVTVAPHPAGPWSEPWLLQEAKGWIDPCPFWDDDGNAWLFHAYANSRAGVRDRLHVRRMAPDASRLLGDGVEIVHAPHHPFLEGPKVHKRDGWYYVMAPGGGVPIGWQVAFRSRHITGPYEEKIVLHRGSTAINGPHQGAFVDTPSGDWWFIHFQDLGPFGRVSHLQPVAWPSGHDWPRIGTAALDLAAPEPGEPVAWARNALLRPGALRIAPATSDSFDSARLGPQWQWNANHDPAWAELLGASDTVPSGLRLHARPVPPSGLDYAPHLLLQKFPARAFTAIATLRASTCELAGLVLCGGGSHASLMLRRDSFTGKRLVYQVGNEILFERPLVGDIELRFRVQVCPDGGCQFLFASSTSSNDLAGALFVAIEPVFYARQGGWMGAKLGLFTGGKTGYADFASFIVL